MAQSEAVSDAKVAEEDLNLEQEIPNHAQSFNVEVNAAMCTF